MRSPAREPATSPPTRWMAAVFFAACAVYAISLFQGFVFDDLPTVVKNSHVRSLRRLPEIFGSTYWAGAGRETPLYRPLTIASYAVNYAVVGLSPWGYHATNVLLHASVAALLLPLALSLGFSLRAGTIGAFCFAVHPLHVEAVTSVVGRAELLAALFVALSLLLHPWAARGGRARVLLPALTFLLALFSKESAISFLALVVLRDLPHAEGKNPRFTLVYLGYGAALLLFVAARSAVVTQGPALAAPFVDNPAAHASSYMRLLTAVAVLGKGLWLHVWPASLSADYSFDSIPLAGGLLDPRVLGSLLAVFGLLAAALLTRRSLPFLPTAWGWYFLALLPASNLLFPIGTIFGERLLYLPSVAFCLAVAAALWPALERLSTKAAVSVAAAGLALLSLRTVTYAASWRDDLSLWTHAARATPGSTKVQYNLAQGLLRAGRHAEAERAFQNVLSGHPRHVETLYAYYLLRQLRGDLEGAVALWHRALAERPNHGPALADLGSHALLRGDLVTAQAYWERAVAADPSLASAWHNLGELYERRGELARAKLAWHRFLAVAGAELAPQRAAVRAKLSRTAP